MLKYNLESDNLKNWSFYEKFKVIYNLKKFLTAVESANLYLFVLERVHISCHGMLECKFVKYINSEQFILSKNVS